MTNMLIKAGSVALSLALVSVGATTVESRSAVEAVIAQAEKDAAAAQAALAKRKPVAAIAFAERAVQARPQDGSYRALLGKAYLAAGRFFSARQAFADALQLDSGSPVGLNYALATTATGDFAGAQRILTEYGDRIAPADRGLALALAGDPATGVQVLIAAARAPEVDAKTRQNLALALALAGRWAEARQMALADLSPRDADARIMQWAAFARPAAASDQVSALLRVTPVADAGVPQQLALVSAPLQVAEAAVETPTPAPAAPTTVAAATWTPDTPLAEVPAAVTPAPAPVPVAIRAAAPAPTFGKVVFAERREVVQALPVTARAERATAVAAGRGSYYVQLGAFRGTNAARAGWNRARARHSALAGRIASTMTIRGGLIRVSVGGFNRSGADQLCRTVKENGGVCFVRVGAGDRVAGWNRVQVASR